jgi:hypothetical protein
MGVPPTPPQTPQEGVRGGTVPYKDKEKRNARSRAHLKDPDILLGFVENVQKLEKAERYLETWREYDVPKDTLA